MKNTQINVLGTFYKIEYRNSNNDISLKDVDGYCDYTSRLIVIKANNNNELGDFERSQKKALRHEIIHAFLAESGLQSNFQHCNEFGHDETMIDWFAIQFPKILKIYKELKITEE